MGAHFGEEHSSVSRTTIGGVFIAGNIGNGKGSGSRPRDFRFNPQSIVPHDNAEIGHFAPIGTPRVAADPIRRLRGLVVPPTDDRDNVIDHHIPNRSIIEYSAFVIQEGFRIDAGSNGSARVYFRLNLRNHSGESIRIIGIGTVFCNGGIGKLFDRETLSRGIASAADIDGRARSIHMRTKAIGRVITARNVGHTGLVRNKTGFLLNVLVYTSCRSSVTRTSSLTSAIQNILNGQVYFIATKVGSVRGGRKVTLRDANPIGQTAERTVSPTRSTILNRICEI